MLSRTRFEPSRDPGRRHSSRLFGRKRVRDAPTVPRMRKRSAIASSGSPFWAATSTAAVTFGPPSDCRPRLPTHSRGRRVSRIQRLDQPTARRGSFAGRLVTDVPELFGILWGLWHFFDVRSDLARAHGLAVELRGHADAGGNPGHRSHAHRALAVALL